MFVDQGSRFLDVLKSTMAQTGPVRAVTKARIRKHQMARDWRFKHALEGPQRAFVVDVLYRALLGRPAGLSDQIRVRRRARDGLSVIDLAHELKASPEGSRVTVHGIAPATRTYLRPFFDAEDGDERDLPRLVFLHFMKVGGTSLSDLFAKWVPAPQARVHVYLDEIALTPAPVLANLRLIAGHIPFTGLPLIPPPYHTMTVLRDPFDRVLSHYSHMRTVNPRYSELTLERFVFDEGFSTVTTNYQARQLAHDIDLENAWRRWSPEHRLEAFGGDGRFSLPLAALFDTGHVGMADDELLRTASANLAAIDIAGVTDHLDAVGYEAAEIFGVPPEAVRRLNVSRPVDRRDLSDRIRRRIDECNAVDRELYDIAKGRAFSGGYLA